MNILIINTAFDFADYIVQTDNKKSSIKTDSNAKHSETSLVNIDKALNDCGVSISDINVVAVNVGPGSFTGIRIGVALAKGFASANPNLKIITFNSFEPLINRINNNGNIYIETGKADYYVAKVINGELTQLNCSLDIDKDESFVILNDQKNLSYNENELIDLVNNKITQNQFCKANEIEPLYLKLSQAEQDLLRKN